MLHMFHCIRLSRYMLYYILVSNKYEQSGVRSHAKIYTLSATSQCCMNTTAYLLEETKQ